MTDTAKTELSDVRYPRWIRHHLHALLGLRWEWKLLRTVGGEDFVRCSRCKHDQAVTS